MDAVVDISKNTVIRKLDVLVIELPEAYQCINNTDNGKTYFIFKKYVKYCTSKRVLVKIREKRRELLRKIKNKCDIKSKSRL